MKIDFSVSVLIKNFNNSFHKRTTGSEHAALQYSSK